MSLVQTKHKRPRRRVQGEYILRRGRLNPSNVLEEKVAELRAMNAPEDVIEFVQSIPDLGIRRVKSEAGQMLDKYGVKWRTETFEEILNQK